MTDINIDVSLAPSDGKTIRLRDIRAWLDIVSKFNLPDDYPIYESSLCVMFPISQQTIFDIECMECSPEQNNQDILIVTHECVNSNNKLAQAYDQAM